VAILSPGVNAELAPGTGANSGLSNQPIWANGQRNHSEQRIAVPGYRPGAAHARPGTLQEVPVNISMYDAQQGSTSAHRHEHGLGDKRHSRKRLTGCSMLPTRKTFLSSVMRQFSRRGSQRPPNSKNRVETICLNYFRHSAGGSMPKGWWWITRRKV
jgi:hypothetical protein